MNCMISVLQTLREALDMRFFFRYHPKLSLVDPEKFHAAGNEELTASEFKFSYSFGSRLLLVKD